MDASVAFARNALRLQYESIPPEVVNVAKRDALDFFACVLAGSSEAGIAEVVDLARDLGGRAEATLFVHGGKVGLLDAALANGAMAHALDYDSTHEGAHLHPSIAVMGAALTLADKLGGVSGKEFLTAVILGTDVVSRLGLAYPVHPVGFIWTMVFGFLGCAVAAGRLLKLDEDEMVSAIGLAYAQASGTQQGNVDGTLDKRMSVGFAARGGILAALMAQKGIRGARNSIEGHRGLFNTYTPKGTYRPGPLTDRLGEHFDGADLSFKPYPTCRFNHSHIDAALALAEEHDIRADEIESILAYVERENHSQFEPLEIKRNPVTSVHAQFSMPYTVALALVKRRVLIDDFTPEAITDPVVIGVANKVSPVVDLSLAVKDPPTAVLEVKTRRGTFTRRIEYPYGHPSNPISDETLAEKVRDCAAHAARPFAAERVSTLIGTVGKLEDVADMREVIGLLA